MNKNKLKSFLTCYVRIAYLQKKQKGTDKEQNIPYDINKYIYIYICNQIEVEMIDNLGKLLIPLPSNNVIDLGCFPSSLTNNITCSLVV